MAFMNSKSRQALKEATKDINVNVFEKDMTHTIVNCHKTISQEYRRTNELDGNDIVDEEVNTSGLAPPIHELKSDITSPSNNDNDPSLPLSSSENQETAGVVADGVQNPSVQGGSEEEVSPHSSNYMSATSISNSRKTSFDKEETDQEENNKVDSSSGSESQDKLDKILLSIPLIIPTNSPDYHQRNIISGEQDKRKMLKLPLNSNENPRSRSNSYPGGISETEAFKNRISRGTFNSKLFSRSNRYHQLPDSDSPINQFLTPTSVDDSTEGGFLDSLRKSKLIVIPDQMKDHKETLRLILMDVLNDLLPAGSYAEVYSPKKQDLEENVLKIKVTSIISTSQTESEHQVGKKVARNKESHPDKEVDSKITKQDSPQERDQTDSKMGGLQGEVKIKSEISENPPLSTNVPQKTLPHDAKNKNITDLSDNPSPNKTPLKTPNQGQITVDKNKHNITHLTADIIKKVQSDLYAIHKLNNQKFKFNLKKLGITDDQVSLNYNPKESIHNNVIIILKKFDKYNPNMNLYTFSINESSL